MNTVVTSKEQILKASRELIQRQGWSAVNIRSVAAACGVSVGSIYNYFDSKAALVGAAVESVWCEIFHRPEDSAVFQDTPEFEALFGRKADKRRKLYNGMIQCQYYQYFRGEEKGRDAAPTAPR